MKESKRIVKNFARSLHIDCDYVLVTLWNYKNKKFDYISNENSRIKTKDYVLAKSLINKPSSISVEIKEEVIHKNYNFSIGKPSANINYLTKSEAKQIYYQLVDDFSKTDNPMSPAGIRNEDLLDSAIFHAQTSYSGKFKYPTIESSAAALMYSISNNHAFINGNKRTSVVASLVFMDRHNYALTCRDSELFDLAQKIAEHKLVEKKYLTSDAEIHHISHWVKDHGKFMKKGDRAISIRRLKQILSHFGCIIYDNGKVTRSVRHSILTIPTTLTSRIPIMTDSYEVSIKNIKRIRTELELTSEFNIDTEIFYQGLEFTVSEFISRYKAVLKRLAKI